MTSWRVVCSMVRIRAGSRRPSALARTAAAVPAGTRWPPAGPSIASHTASSISSQRANRAPSDHIAVSSGRL